MPIHVRTAAGAVRRPRALFFSKAKGSGAWIGDIRCEHTECACKRMLIMPRPSPKEFREDASTRWLARVASRSAPRHPRRTHRIPLRITDSRGTHPHRGPARSRTRRHPHQPLHHRCARHRRPNHRLAPRPHQRDLRRRRVQRRRDHRSHHRRHPLHTTHTLTRHGPADQRRRAQQRIRDHTPTISMINSRTRAASA